MDDLSQDRLAFATGDEAQSFIEEFCGASRVASGDGSGIFNGTAARHPVEHFTRLG
jgi:hypothetical protein